ncbi:MAG: VWA domain-containing protein, partial [Candidatus Wallbacteria bacterium]|nr:VWA domain-containing protein [Candidatus Wallbacteria bacterium]
VPGGRRRAYELAAALIPAPVAGKPTEVVVSVREARLGVNVARLSSGDLDVYEDGEKQTVASMALESDGGRPVYRLQYTRPLPPMASVHLTSPASGAQITGILNIVADAGSGTAPVGLRTDIYVDQEPIGCFDRLPARVTEPVEAFAAGKHVVRAVLRDRFGRVAEERCEVALRHSLPDLAVLQPSEGSALWGDAKLEVSAGGVQPRRVELMMDATVLKTFGGDTAPVQVASADLDSSALPADASVRIVGAARVYTAGFNARAVPEGLHRFGVRMLTADGRTLEKRVSARVVRPLVAVRFVTPAFRARLTGKVPLAAEAVCSWPELGVARMEFTANGKRLGIVEHAPYVYQWDTSGWAPGRYRIDAVAAASSGDVGSAAVFVEVTRPDAAAALEGAFDGMTLASPAVLHAVVIGPGGSRVQRLACLVDGHTAASGGAGPLAVRLDPAAHGEGDADVAVEAVLVDGKKIGRTYRVHMAPSRRPSTWACALRHGAPVPFAELPAPEVLVDSVPARGLRIRPAATAPASWALVVDVSASMAAAERQASLKEAAGKFIEGLGREDRVALFVFNDEVTLARPFSTDKDGVLEALSNARAYGATALNDAVYRAAEALGHEPGRRVAVLVTDGVDQNIDWTGPASTHLLPQAVAMARSAGVVVHAIGLGRELRQENALGERLLFEISDSLNSRLASQRSGHYDPSARAARPGPGGGPFPPLRVFRP